MNNSQETEYRIPYAKSARMESPYPDDKRVVFHFFVNVNDLPEGLPTDVNPREVNTKKKVYKTIVKALAEANNSFFVDNRGLLIAAKGITVDALNKVLKLNVGNGTSHDNALYGVLDGGHTYNAIINHRNEVAEDDVEYVHLEIMTSVSNIDELASARNTSVQVSDKAIAELADKFAFIKQAIIEEPYANSIAYKENADEPLDAVDFVRLLFAFNIFKYHSNSTAQPIAAYSGKAFVLKDYLKEYDNRDNPYKKLALLLPKITQLYDAIEKEMPEAYRQNTKNGLFGKIKGVEPKKNKGRSKFYGGTIDYTISQGLIFPILSAFRALITENENGQLTWAIDPLEVWTKVKVKLVNNTIEMSRSLGNNPQSAGKNASLWSQNYDAVNTAKLEISLQQLQESGHTF